MLKLLILAFSLGLDDGAVGVSLGLGTPKLARIVEISLVFGLVQSVFPALGILVGDFVGGKIGHVASIVGFALLIGLGVMTIFLGLRGEREEAAANEKGLMQGHVGVWLAGVAVSLDSLAVGISLGFSGGATLWQAILVLGLSAVIMTFIGLLVGSRVGPHFGELAEVASGALLALTGVGLLLQKLFEMKVL